MTTEPRPLPYFGTNWRVSEHGIFNGTMRIAKFDFDTCPSDEVKQAMYGELLALLRTPELQATLTAVRTELATLQATHQRNVELLAHATEKAVKLTATNARLRELLRRAAPFVPIENTLTPELRKELGNV